MCVAIRAGETFATAGVLLVVCFLSTSHVVDASGGLGRKYYGIYFDCSRVNGNGNPYLCDEDKQPRGVKSWLCHEKGDSGEHRIRCHLAKQSSTPTPTPLECVFYPGKKHEVTLQPGFYKFSKKDEEALKQCYPANGTILRSRKFHLNGMDKSKVNEACIEAGMKPTADSDSLI